ncbi:hypothetical protein XHC_3576 [Xanthomonas hortorum pv. carotae str. M081]|nr:hypothetical protein XHC_3576 [Xanthomonas hortorum pv. carotae str. M081]
MSETLPSGTAAEAGVMHAIERHAPFAGSARMFDPGERAVNRSGHKVCR